jgi:tetratricopeptide (TPR) repeat protein
MTRRLIAALTIFAFEGMALAGPSPEELFNQGQASYAKGDYTSAVAKWNESYRLSKEPELLFNIAEALRDAGQCAEALATFRRFITIAPGSEQRPLADEFVRELAAKCDAVGASPPPTIDNPDERTRPGGTQKLVGLAVAGVGVVSVATGLYFGHRASSLGEEVMRACPGTGCIWVMLANKDAEGRSAETKQYVFAGIGIAAIIGGGVTYWLASREHRTPSIAITSGRDGARITWSGTW